MLPFSRLPCQELSAFQRCSAVWRRTSWGGMTPTRFGKTSCGLVEHSRIVEVRTEGLSARQFAGILERSLIKIAPRGYGGSSFCFFEAIQKGSIPWLIGDIDTRPFKESLDWSVASFYSETVDEFIEAFNNLNLDEVLHKLRIMTTTIRPKMKLGEWQGEVIASLAQIQQTE